MRRVARKSAWIVALAVGLVLATVLWVGRVDSPAPDRAAATTSDAPAPASRSEAPAARDEPALPPQTPGDVDAIPFAARIYPATPLPATDPAASRPHPAAAAANPASPDRSAPAPGGAHGPFSAPPLAADTPLSTVLDRLKSAADAGDRDAACRVGLELLRCASGAPLVAATTRGPVLTEAQCAGMSPAERQSAARYLAQAAAAGSAAARRALAGDAAVSPVECGR